MPNLCEISRKIGRQVNKKQQENNFPVNGVKVAAKFSGIFSQEDDLAFDPSVNLPMRHNNMHFRKIPPFLKRLSTTELALVSKIAVTINVHVLKTGLIMGHCVSLPQPLNEAKQLPRLPAEVNIIILKRVGADGRIKHYFAKRSNVQEALEGLCYGFPHGGCDEPDEVSTEKYTGRDHLQLPLNGRYFQYIPNPYYCDVEIMYDRLNKLPTRK